METDPGLSDLRLDGGHLALDFVNTLGGLRGREPQPHDEFLHDYGDLLAWCRLTGVLEREGAERLTRQARRRPSEAAAVFHRGLEIRALFDRVFRTIAEGRTPAKRDLSTLRDEASRALQNAELTAEAGGFRWSWPDGRTLEAPLWPLAHAAAELLTEGPLERLRCCDRCRWLFLDESKNRSRRWCSMEDCGTAAKKERYVERRRRRRMAGTGRPRPASA